MGESSRSLSSMWFLLPLALPAIVACQCQVNLDKVSGKFPPLLLQKSKFIFPTEKVEDERVLNFKEGDSLELFCHGGSDENITVETASSNQKQEQRLDRTQEQCSPVGSD